jgi:hypothetical protein
MHSLWKDLRFGVRMMAKNPGFTAVAVLTLALGIGANTAIFSVLDPLLLRMLPVHNPNELVRINAAGTLGPLELSEVQSFYRYRDENSVFSGVLAFSPVGDCEITINDHSSPARDAGGSDDCAAAGIRHIKNAKPPGNPRGLRYASQSATARSRYLEAFSMKLATLLLSFARSSSCK